MELYKIKQFFTSKTTKIMALNTNQDDVTLETGFRKDSQAASFRDVHSRYYPKVYDYSLCQTKGRAEAMKESDIIFVKLAKTMTNLVNPEETVRGMSNDVLDAREARRNN